MVNNGSLTYDHDKDGTLTQLAGCEAKFRNVNHDTYLSIRYENDVLTVSTDIENKGQWKQCFSAAGVKLPTGYYFGASAETGDLSDNHDVFSFKFYEITPTNVSCDWIEFVQRISRISCFSFSIKTLSIECRSFQKRLLSRLHVRERTTSNQACQISRYVTL